MWDVIILLFLQLYLPAFCVFFTPTLLFRFHTPDLRLKMCKQSVVRHSYYIYYRATDFPSLEDSDFVFIYFVFKFALESFKGVSIWRTVTLLTFVSVVSSSIQTFRKWCSHTPITLIWFVPCDYLGSSATAIDIWQLTYRSLRHVQCWIYFLLLLCFIAVFPLLRIFFCLEDHFFLSEDHLSCLRIIFPSGQSSCQRSIKFYWRKDVKSWGSCRSQSTEWCLKWFWSST